MTSRRSVLMGAAALSLCVSSGLKAQNAAASEELWDVVVIGAGAAGLCAAAAALESGARRVLILEKGPLVGGHSIYSSGSVAAVSQRRSHDPLDTVERFVQDAMDVGSDTGDKAILKKIAADSEHVLDWLESLGVTWSSPFVAYSGAHAKSYAMPGNSAGRSYVLTLMSHVRSFGARVLLSSCVTDIEPNGQYWIVKTAKNECFKTCSVVVASGGFTANVKKRMLINPLLTKDVTTTANPDGTVFDGATGEMLNVLAGRGAFITTGFGLQALPFWGGRLLDYQGADIYVDEHGRRFVNENSPWNIITNAILSLPKKRCWIITDSQSHKGATLGAKLINGVVKKSDSIEEMAAAMRVDLDILHRTITEYNKAVEAGFDPKTGKKTFRQKIEKPPFYWGPEKIYVHTTLDGVRTNVRAQVLCIDGKILPGIFAAGECVGGIFGQDRLGGAGMSACFVMGREAGHGAALRARRLHSAG